jgi:hypothetical protein
MATMTTLTALILAGDVLSPLVVFVATCCALAVVAAWDRFASASLWASLPRAKLLDAATDRLPAGVRSVCVRLTPGEVGDLVAGIADVTTGDRRAIRASMRARRSRRRVAARLERPRFALTVVDHWTDGADEAPWPRPPRILGETETIDGTHTTVRWTTGRVPTPVPRRVLAARFVPRGIAAATIAGAGVMAGGWLAPLCVALGAGVFAPVLRGVLRRRRRLAAELREIEARLERALTPYTDDGPCYRELPAPPPPTADAP